MKKRKIKKQKKVVVAMSGGVDSGVAAALLKQQGFDVSGIFMRLWSAPHPSKIGERSEVENRVRQVADVLDIPLFVFNIKKKFKKKIVDYFLREYKQGITPNPCVNCNKEIKFGLLLDEALRLGADYLATGHYARLRRENKEIHLLRGKDKTKDQSYFLWKLEQKQLKHILFPVGDYTKIQVRKMAKKFTPLDTRALARGEEEDLSSSPSCRANLTGFNLPTFDIPESQEICFIKDTVNNFLTKYIKTKPGPILIIDNKKIGEHQGLPFYTIGQRKGIELSGGPFYVVDKKLKENTLIVTPFYRDKSLYRKKLIAKDLNWIAGMEPKLPLKVKAQIRYGHKSVLAVITKNLNPKTYTLKFARPQRAITPGQSVVFYRYKELLGGGIIY